MAFSKGKRIEDETSKRIVDHAMIIGCREGADALTVTRLCRELNCDRRVIYNRFRDVDEINLIVARKCSEELIANARVAMNQQNSFYDNFMAFIKAAFTYIYEKNSHFQYYTAMYKVTDEGVRNGVLQVLEELIEEGIVSGEVKSDIDSGKLAKSIWLIATGISGILAANSNYKYQDGLDTVMYGVRAVLEYMVCCTG